MPATRDAKTRLAQARTRLVLDRPFLGALVLQLPLVEGGDWCRTTATDTQSFYYNPAYIDRLTGEEVQSVLCHEALHCALLHLHRRGHRARERWDVACDYAANCLLVAEDMILPQGALYEPKFADLTAEEIYPCLDEMEDKRTRTCTCTAIRRETRIRRQGPARSAKPNRMPWRRLGRPGFPAPWTRPGRPDGCPGTSSAISPRS